MSTGKDDNLVLVTTDDEYMEKWFWRVFLYSAIAVLLGIGVWWAVSPKVLEFQIEYPETQLTESASFTGGEPVITGMDKISIDNMTSLAQKGIFVFYGSRCIAYLSIFYTCELTFVADTEKGLYATIEATTSVFVLSYAPAYTLEEKTVGNFTAQKGPLVVNANFFGTAFFYWLCFCAVGLLSLLYVMTRPKSNPLKK